MEKYLALTVVVLVIQIAHAQYVPYDCRRVNQICHSDVTGGRCNSDTGACGCTNPNFQGYDCTLPTAQVRTPAACAVDCGGRGTCFDDGTGSKCFCDPAYYGAQCQFDRVSLQCFADYMLVRVFPHEFIGDVFVSTLPPDVEPGCQFEAAPDGNGLMKNLSFSEDRAANPCLPNLSVATSNIDGTQIFTYELIVRYSPAYTSFVDEIHTVTCRHTLNGPLIGTVVQVDGGPTNGVVVSGNTTVLTLDITRQSDGASVSGNNIVSFIGEDLNIEVTVKADTRYNNHLVENCGAYNLPLTLNVDPNRIEKTLVSNSCPAANSQDVLRGPLSKVRSTVFIPFKAFKFNTGELHVYCSVRVCVEATDPLCLPRDCTAQDGGPGSGYGRRKRAADDDNNAQINMTTSIFVVTRREPSAEKFTERIVEQSCFKSVAFLSVTAAFGTLLLVTLLITVVLWHRHNKREKELAKGKYSDNA